MLRLLRKAFLVTETDNTEDCCTQIMSTFGKVLKYDSTTKITLTQAYWEQTSLNKYSLNFTEIARAIMSMIAFILFLHLQKSLDRG